MEMKMVDGIQWRAGFKGKNQLPLFMIWKEEWHENELVYAWVWFDSRWWFGK